MKTINLSLILMLSVLVTACRIEPKAMRVDTDPNEQDRQALREKQEIESIEAFIVEHPELDEQMKKDLRNGTISRKVALERLNQRK
jgi:hypothetical protein